MKDPRKEQSELWSRTAESIEADARSVVAALANGEQPVASARQFTQGVLEMMAIADLLGRRRAMLEFDALADRVPLELMEQVTFAASTPSSFPEVPFEAAIADLLARDPRLAQSAVEVAAIYQADHAFSLANSIELAITLKARDALQRATLGATAKTAKTLIAEAGNFTKGYAETVYRTNMNTAYTAGRMSLANDPDVARVVAAYFRWEILDSDVRRGRKEDGGENHAAVHGLIAGTKDPIWKYTSPPSGYNCRGGLNLMSKFQLKEQGLLGPNGEVKRKMPPNFSSFKPHPHFRVSPLQRIYGGGGLVA